MSKLADGRRIFESAGHWYISGSNQMFNTETEVLEMTKKQKFVEAIRAMMTALAIEKDNMPVMEEIWNDRSYLSGITSDDLAAMGQDITTTQLAAGITMIQEQIKFYGNIVVATADYGATISDLRTDK